MKIAAIYDIHANPNALNAVLNEIEESDVELIIIGGDVIAGPLPNETLTLLKQASTPMRFILGNAESEVLRHLNGEKIRGLSERANEEARWVSNQLTDENKIWISNWDKTITIDMANFGKVLFCHGTPRSNVEIFTRLTPVKKLASIFEDVAASIVVCGHTHIQFDITIGDNRVINAGSVGMPFGKTGSDWILIDNIFEFKHTDYDLNEAAENIRKSNYPQAESFLKNNVLNPLSERDSLKMLTKMELNQEKNGYNDE